MTAATRILELSKKTENAIKKDILNRIAGQERKHAEWVKQLLVNRKVEIPSLDNAENRYWAKTLPAIKDFDTGAAVGAHAEKMRLERILAIVNDPETPYDIFEVFCKIVAEEWTHERLFREMAGMEAMKAVLPAAAEGRNALGLEP